MPPEVNNLLRWNPTVILSKGTFLLLGGWKIPPKVDHAIGTTRVPRDFNVCHGWKHIQHHQASLPWDHALLSFWFCACRIYMRWAKKLPFTCSTLQKHSGAMFPQGVNVCLPTRIFMLVLSKLFGWHSTKSIRSSPAFFSWTSCPVITKQNVFYPSAWSLVTCSPFKISPGTLLFDVAKTNQFSALWHLKRILAAVCSLARRSAAPPKGMEREDGICDLTTWHGMSCLTALHKKKLKLISSIKQPLAHRESGMLGYVIRS